MVILLGVLAAFAVPRFPSISLFQQQFDVRQVVSSLARLRAHAINSQCYVVADFADQRLRALIETDCGGSTGAEPRNFATELAFIDTDASGGVTRQISVVFTPTGEARRTSASLDDVDITALTDFSSEPEPGVLALTHTSASVITLHDTTGYTAWQ